MIIITEYKIYLKKSIENLFNNKWIFCKPNNNYIGNNTELLLGLSNNNLEIPDYNEYEIKTHQFNKNSFITLFNATPDCFLFVIKEINYKYGYKDNLIKNCKIFNHSFYSNKEIYIGNNRFAKLNIDKKNEKIDLLIIENNKIIDIIYWSFELIKEKINRKIKKIIDIKVEKKYINGLLYYRYHSYDLYIFKDFDTFLNLLSNDKIRISFKIGVFRSGKRLGQIHDRGTSFEIDSNFIEELYIKSKL